MKRHNEINVNQKNDKTAENKKLATDDYGEERNFQRQLDEHRLETAACVSKFPFKKKRVRILTTVTEVSDFRRGGVLYWMLRDARVQDNWAFLFAQKLALKLKVPLLVAFCVIPSSKLTFRRCAFLLGGLQELEQQCRTLQIPFYLLLGPPETSIPQFVREYNIGAIVCDFSPLRSELQAVEDVKQALPTDVPLSQVDAHNLVPVWVASEKQEYAARTIRTKIKSKLTEFLTDFPPLICHTYAKKEMKADTDWAQVYATLECNRSVDKLQWAEPGYTAACAQLREFCVKRLSIFALKRNDPTVDALSNLSPWLNFGQISAQRCVLEVQRFTSQHKKSVESFCEELIIRRELADNFCFYNKHYDSLKGVAAWAIKTLDDHRKDKRNFSYNLSEFEEARTHDDLWNAAQLQLVRQGKMHGFLRMYWAKKILEWTATPDDALETAIHLNDKYSLDGCDPNGYVGCLWSIGGIHDQGWAERPIFGKVRYMNYEGCKRKFDVNAFVARYRRGKIVAE